MIYSFSPTDESHGRYLKRNREGRKTSKRVIEKITEAESSSSTSEKPAV